MPNEDKNKNKGGVTPTNDPNPNWMKRVRQNIAFSASDGDKTNYVDKDGIIKNKYRVVTGEQGNPVLRMAGSRGDIKGSDTDYDNAYGVKVVEGDELTEYTKSGSLDGTGWGQTLAKLNTRRGLELKDGTVIEGFDAINQYLSEADEKGDFSDIANMIEGDKKYRMRLHSEMQKPGYLKGSMAGQGWNDAYYSARNKNKNFGGLDESALKGLYGGKYTAGEAIDHRDREALYRSEFGINAWFNNVDVETMAVNDIIDRFNTGAAGITSGGLIPQKPKEGENPRRYFTNNKGTSGTPTNKGGVSANTKKI